MTKPSPDNVLGIVSLIVWTLTILVSIEYAWLATSLSHRGEGGAIVLREIVLPLLKSGRVAAFVTVLTLIGVSLLLGDGVITPAISILSAAEGIVIIPGMEQTSGKLLLAVAMVITIILFLFQSRGTDKIAWMFGPIMMMQIFQKSSNLAAAYGMAVTGSMTITGIVMMMVFYHQEKWKVPIAALVAVVDLLYLTSTFMELKILSPKIPYGRCSAS